MLFNQILCHRPKILRFVAIEPSRFDLLFQLILANRRKFVGGRISWEKISGNNVDTLISALSGKNRGNQQLKRCLEIQLAMRARINFAQPLNDALKSFFGSHFFGIRIGATLSASQ